MFKDGMTRNDLNLTEAKTVDVVGLDDNIKPRQDLKLKITYNDDTEKEICVMSYDTLDEIDYYRNGGILQYVLRNMLKDDKKVTLCLGVVPPELPFHGPPHRSLTLLRFTTGTRMMPCKIWNDKFAFNFYKSVFCNHII